MWIFLICDKSLEIKRRGLNEGRDKPKDILIMLYLVLPKSFSKARQYFSTVPDKECVRSSDVDLINLNSGTGCAVMLKISCVSVFESMISFQSPMMNELHVPTTRWKGNWPFTRGWESYKSSMICVLLFLWAFALVLTSLV